MIYESDDRLEPYCVLNDECLDKITQGGELIKELQYDREDLKKLISNVVLLTNKNNLMSCNQGKAYWLKTEVVKPNAVKVDPNTGVNERLQRPLCPSVNNNLHEQHMGGISRPSRFCTGFLAKTDHGPRLVTAGHCVRGDSGAAGLEEEELVGILNYQLTDQNQTNYFFPAQSIIDDLTIDEDIDGKKQWVCRGNSLACPGQSSVGAYTDVAILRAGKINKNFGLSVVVPNGPLSPNLSNQEALGFSGHPAGMPKKVSLAPKATYRTVEQAFPDGTIEHERLISKFSKMYYAHFDAFGGDSGAPVFGNQRPDLVVGMLLGGQTDYEIGEHRGEACWNFRALNQSKYPGELVLNAKYIHSLLEKTKE